MSGGLVVVRTLRHEVVFDCTDATAFERLRYLAARPDMPSRDLAPVAVEVAKSDIGYALRQAGGVTECPLVDLLDTAHALVRDLMIRECEGGLLLHAASMKVGDRMFVLFGEKGAGKTTLAIKAMLSGLEVHGDEHVFLEGAQAITRPRTLRIKEKSLALFPDLDARLRTQPFCMNWDNTPIYALPPGTETVRWTIRPYRIDHFVHLEANHGGQSTLKPLDPAEAFSLAMAQAFLPEAGGGRGLAMLWEALSCSKIWRLKLGDLDQAIRVLSATA